MKLTWAVFVGALLVVLASCPVDPGEPEQPAPESVEPGGTPAALKDLGTMHYDDAELSVEGVFPDSSGEAYYLLCTELPADRFCAVKTKYRLEVKLVPSMCLDCSLELYVASGAKTPLEVANLSVCGEEKLTHDWEGDCMNHDLRQFLIAVKCVDRNASTLASVPDFSFNLYIKPLKVRITK
jgi:hypothetical protein